MKKNNLSLHYKHKIPPKKGFTLIELLIVIAIIGILASIVLVNLTGATGKANRAAFIGEARSASSGIMVQCLTDLLVLNAGALKESSNIRYTALGADDSCGPTGNRTFCVKIVNKNAFVETDPLACNTAYVSQNGLWSTADCKTPFLISDCK